MRHQLPQAAGREVRDGFGAVGQLCDGSDTCLQQRRTLADPHARDQQEVIRALHLGFAYRTPKAGAHMVIGPPHRYAAREVVIQQVLQLLSPLAVDAHQVRRRIVDGRTVAQDQSHRRRDGDACRRQAVGVGRQL